MARYLIDDYAEFKRRLLGSCITCGNCVKSCRTLKYIDLGQKPQELQAQALAFLRGKAELEGEARKRMSACVRCHGCFDLKCPIGLDGMSINELLRYEAEKRSEAPWSVDFYAVHRERVAELAPGDRERITRARAGAGAKYLIFPGCNVYCRPELILNALDIADCIADDYAFLPGVGNCCGNVYSYLSHPGKLEDNGRALVAALAELRPETVVFWCPTCICVMEQKLKRIMELPFRRITFGQFIAENLGKLRLSPINDCVTPHEPCKTTYMGIDRGESLRAILNAIPGLELREMAHGGDSDTLCCGCPCAEGDKPAAEAAGLRRLDEAAATGANRLIDVCHNCHNAFSALMPAHPEYTFALENYTDLIKRSLGLPERQRGDSYG